MFYFDPTSLLQVDIDTDRAMVGAPFVGPDKSLVYAPHRSRRCEDVVDPPSDVPLARAAPLPPPRVLVRHPRDAERERYPPSPFCRLGRLCSGGGELSQDHALALDRRLAEAHDRFRFCWQRSETGCLLKSQRRNIRS